MRTPAAAIPNAASTGDVPRMRGVRAHAPSCCFKEPSFIIKPVECKATSVLHSYDATGHSEMDYGRCYTWQWPTRETETDPFCRRSTTNDLTKSAAAPKRIKTPTKPLTWAKAMPALIVRALAPARNVLEIRTLSGRLDTGKPAASHAFIPPSNRSHSDNHTREVFPGQDWF